MSCIIGFPLTVLTNFTDLDGSGYTWATVVALR